MLISSGKDKVHIFDNFLNKEECEKYLNQIPFIGFQENIIPWDLRTKNITNDLIVNKATEYLNKKFDLDLKINQAQLQNHNVNSFSDFHIHDSNDREGTGFNSLIYLNDDFEGGEFKTKEGIKIKPKKGMLTFFRGDKVWHGVERVYLKDRKTIILWWKNEESK